MTFGCPALILPVSASARYPYRGTSLIRNTLFLGPYNRTIPRILWCSQGGGGFLWSRYSCIAAERTGNNEKSYADFDPKGQSLASTVLYVPYSLGSGLRFARAVSGMHRRLAHATSPTIWNDSIPGHGAKSARQQASSRHEVQASCPGIE